MIENMSGEWGRVEEANIRPTFKVISEAENASEISRGLISFQLKALGIKGGYHLYTKT